MSATSGIRLANQWLSLLLAVAFLSACGGGGAPMAGGGNTPPSGCGTPATGFAVFTSDRTPNSNRNPLAYEPWIASFDGSDHRSLSNDLPGAKTIRWRSARLSPDGRYVAVVTDAFMQGTQHHYAIIETASGNAHVLPFIDDYHTVGAASEFFWSPDSSRLVLRRSAPAPATIDQDRWGRTYIMNADGSNLLEPMLTGTDNFWAYAWSPAGTHFVLESDPVGEINGMDNPDRSDNVFMVSADGASAIDIMPTVGVDRSFVNAGQFWSADGSKFAFRYGYKTTPNAQDSSIGIAVHDTLTGVTTPVTSVTNNANIFLLGMSADGNWITYQGDDNRLYLVASTGGASTPISPSGNDIFARNVTWAPTGARLAYNLDNQTTNTRTLYIADSSGTFQPLHSPGNRLNVFSWAPDGRYLAFTITDAAFNAPLYVFDTRTSVPPELITTEPKLLKGAITINWSRNSQWLYAAKFDDAQQSYVVRTYPAGNWTSGRTLGTAKAGKNEPPGEHGILAVYPTPDSIGAVWRQTDSNGADHVVFGNPTDPALTRTITQDPLPGVPGTVHQLFAR